MHVHIHVAVPLVDMNIYLFVSEGLSNIKRQIWTTIVAHNVQIHIFNGYWSKPLLPAMNNSEC
jgi:hypothetical protein